MNDGKRRWPFCCTCGEDLYQLPVWTDVLRFQHGENPEHILTLTYLEIAAHPDNPRRYLERRINDWVATIHDFEQNGIWAGAPHD